MGGLLREQLGPVSADQPLGQRRQVRQVEHLAERVLVAVAAREVGALQVVGVVGAVGERAELVLAERRRRFAEQRDQSVRERVAAAANPILEEVSWQVELGGWEVSTCVSRT